MGTWEAPADHGGRRGAAGNGGQHWGKSASICFFIHFCSGYAPHGILPPPGMAPLAVHGDGAVCGAMRAPRSHRAPHRARVSRRGIYRCTTPVLQAAAYNAPCSPHTIGLGLQQRCISPNKRIGPPSLRFSAVRPLSCNIPCRHRSALVLPKRAARGALSVGSHREICGAMGGDVRL